jgi:U3 small nucleolar RNA-associated protein 11
MLSSRTDDHGRKITDRGNKALSTSVVKLLKTQDAAYLRTVGVMARKKRESIEKEVLVGEELGSSGSKRGQKIVFVESREEQREYGGSVDRRNDSDSNREDEEEMEIEIAATQRSVKSSKTLEAEAANRRAERLLRKQRKRFQDARKSKLEALKTRERELYKAEQELDLQRAKMSNSVGGVTKAGVKWKVRERKR